MAVHIQRNLSPHWRGSRPLHFAPNGTKKVALTINCHAGRTAGGLRRVDSRLCASVCGQFEHFPLLIVRYEDIARSVDRYTLSGVKLSGGGKGLNTRGGLLISLARSSKVDVARRIHGDRRGQQVAAAKADRSRRTGAIGNLRPLAD